MKLRLIQRLLLLCCTLWLPHVATAKETAENKARVIWEQAIVAKGGRDRLTNIHSLSMSYEETVRNFLGIVVHTGAVERLYIFPDKSWAWDDGLPPPFRRTLVSLDIEKNIRCHLSDSASAPTCGPATGISPIDEGLTQVQYLYLMETTWVRPSPYDVTTDHIGFKRVDVVHTRFANKRIDYYLDRKTHLPSRVKLFYGTSNRPSSYDRHL